MTLFGDRPTAKNKIQMARATVTAAAPVVRRRKAASRRRRNIVTSPAHRPSNRKYYVPAMMNTVVKSDNNVDSSVNYMIRVCWRERERRPASSPEVFITAKAKAKKR